jgi:two-component system, LytTR family, sensor kinase
LAVVNLTSRNFYWACQLGGWALYIFLNALILMLNGNLNSGVAFRFIFVFVLGIGLTEFFRLIVIRLNWLRLSIPQALPRVLFVNLLMGTSITIVMWFFEKSSTVNVSFRFSSITIANIVNYSFAFFAWSLIYFLVHYLDNYKKAEIEKLRWEAISRETELNQLKSQLNPHFMFNSMNSIRALVGENPEKAKEAVTQLSNLLRSTLQMGKQKFIPLAQEIAVVKDYLAIESIRLEERLVLEWNVDEDLESAEFPPLLLQTLVENGIKHGIAKIPKGGKLSIKIIQQTQFIEITIRNSGQFVSERKTDSGFGLKNTRERLQLLYGEMASVKIENENAETVITRLSIPVKTKIQIA